MNKLIEIFSICTLIGILVASLLLITVFKKEASFNMAVFISIISTISSAVIIFYSNNIMRYGIFSVLFLYFTLTHFGASTIYYINPEIVFNNFNPHQYIWINTQYVALAILSSVVAQCTLIISGIVFGGRIRRRNVNDLVYKQSSSIWLPRLGIILLIIVIIYYFINIVIGNISLRLGYYQFVEWRNSSSFFSYSIFLLATGFIFIVSSGSKKQIKIGIILYSIISVILLLTGNKGEILYAALVAVGVYYSRGNRIHKKIFLFGALIFFVIIPFITSVRQGSIIQSINQLGINMTSPFLEIGWQLRTVERVIYWIESGEKLGFGISYFAPIQRIISSLTLGIIPRIPITNVPWAFGERLPGWGFSQVAESYYNFSIFGPVIFYFIQGWFSVVAENEKKNIYRKTWYASIAVILMILTRNRFSFVPGQVVWALALTIIAYILDGKIEKGGRL